MSESQPIYLITWAYLNKFTTFIKVMSVDVPHSHNQIKFSTCIKLSSFSNEIIHYVFTDFIQKSATIFSFFSMTSYWLYACMCVQLWTCVNAVGNSIHWRHSHLLHLQFFINPADISPKGAKRDIIYITNNTNAVQKIEKMKTF